MPKISAPYSPDGSRYALFGHPGILIRDTKSWEVVSQLTGHTDTVCCVAFHPDGRTLASGSFDNTIRLWDVETGINKHILRAHTEGVGCVAFSPDGKTIASASSEDNTIRLWDVETGCLLETFMSHTRWFCLIPYSPDDCTYACWSGGLLNRGSTIYLRDLETDDLLHTLEHTDAVSRIAFDSYGVTIATAMGSTLYLWKVETGCRLHTLAHTDRVGMVAFNGGTVASESLDGAIHLWDVATGDLLRTFTMGGYDGKTESLSS